jgi:hypothetical protein
MMAAAVNDTKNEDDIAEADAAGDAVEYEDKDCVRPP